MKYDTSLDSQRATKKVEGKKLNNFNRNANEEVGANKSATEARFMS